jgi:hypothetical protein
MKWIFGVMLATLAATVTVNVLLLGYGWTRNDPVGRLSPVAYLPAPAHAHVDNRQAQHAADD